MYFPLPTASYVNKSNAKSSTTSTLDLTQNVKVLPYKPNILPAWRPTPSTDSSNLLQHYLKLSKIRLTSMFSKF